MCSSFVPVTLAAIITLTEHFVSDDFSQTGCRSELDSLLADLGRALFDELERLGPSAPGGVAKWDELTNWQRGLYVNGVKRLIEEREFVQRANHLADDDSIEGGPEE